MNWTLWHNGDCSKSRAAKTFLKGLKVDPTVVDYLDGTLTHRVLDEMLIQLEMQPEQLVRKSEPKYQELGLEQNPPSTRDDWIKTLLQNPILIERPIISNGTRAVIGRPVTRILEIFPKPNLDKPGAGLPFLQSLAVRYWVGPHLSKKADLNRVSEAYEGITQKILKSVQDTDEGLRQVPVFVTPIAGLEDSSRFWSLTDVMEHILIVTPFIQKIVLSLDAIENGNRNEYQSLQAIDIAKAKPTRVLSPSEIFEEYQKAIPGLSVKLLSGLSQKAKEGKGLKVTHPHPWMGPFNTRQWFWLLASHHQIHWKQTKQILEGLS